ncbi:extracellular solute-binding protein [Agromyces intestinalis]|uniref:Extracellular solute-binding protein n=1 Tax=Agromyces intestinalis TaxID=2592652 RepID=A0A5C1YI41_9MICO|nr:extracellular solute-binding protein [Agromyces intestinalis]QEO14442.1 extracellular solute-binding protein [Agromyces intestinalis]
MKFRSVVAAAAAATVAVALAGCAGASGDETAAAPDAESAGPVTLEWWTWWAGAPAIADAWNTDHPDITVKVNNVGGGTEQFTKLNAAIRAGEGPDLALAEYQWLPSYVSNGVAADIAEYVGDAEAAYNPAVWSLVQLGDGVYAVPLDQAPMLMMYRVDLFEQYGIEVPRTWDEFRDAAEAVKRAAPDSVLVNMPINDAGWMAGLVAQNGTSWWAYKNDAWSVDIDGKGSRQVAEYWNGLVDDGLATAGATGTPEFNTQLNTGKILTQVIGSWGATGSSIKSGAPDTLGKWRIANLPAWKQGDADVGFQGGSATLVTTVSKHPKQAAEFLTWLGSTAEGQRAMIEAGGNFPASNPGLEEFAKVPLPDDKACSGQEDYHDVLLDVAANEAEVTWGPNTTIAFSAYSDQMPKAKDGGTRFVDALTSVDETVTNDLEKSGFTVD